MSIKTKTTEAATTARATAQAASRRRGEASFTLIETVIALAIVAFLIVEVAVVQGNAIVFSNYGRNITQASWLARRVMSRVEYYWRTKPFKELITHQGDQPFEDFPEYTYSIEIAEWKFPFTKLLEQALGGSKGKRDKDKKDDLDARSSTVDSSMKDMVEQVVKQVFGDEPIFLMANVQVSWAEGAQSNHTGLTYLMTNQAKLDEAIISMKDVYTRLTKPPATPGKPPNQPPPDPNNPNPNPNTNPNPNPNTNPNPNPNNPNPSPNGFNNETQDTGQ